MWHINDPLSVTEGGTMEAKRLKETKHIKAHHYMSKILWTSVHNQTSCHSWLESFWIKVRTFAFTRRQAVFVFSTLVLFSILIEEKTPWERHDAQSIMREGVVSYYIFIHTQQVLKKEVGECVRDDSCLCSIFFILFFNKYKSIQHHTCLWPPNSSVQYVLYITEHCIFLLITAWQKWQHLYDIFRETT